MVASFLRDLRKWIIEQKKLDARRVTSNQYLSATMSHDEFLTEEDQGAESTQEQKYPKSSIPALDTLEGATAALRSLLKVQPPTQGLQTDVVKSPVPRDSGSELLALLQGKAQPPNQDARSNVPPQTPLDHTLSQPHQPKTPHHQPPRPPHFSSLPPPPIFPIQQASSSFSYQEPSQPRHDYRNDSFQEGQQINLQASRNQAPPHYQSQHLIHPQPLPPHVQRAVFTGGPVHSPMVPQPHQSYVPQLQSTISVPASNPQFPGIHAPMVPPVPAKSPPKLTSHKLALLNAFKIRDEANGENGASSDLPLRRYVQDLASPQELPAETPQPAPVDLLSLFKAKDSPPQSSNPTIPPPRPISEAHKSTLLGLFKSPTPQSAAPLKPAATAFPISATPSAVELSAVEPHSNAGPVSTSKKNASKGDFKEQQSRDIPELNPEANLPFRAMSILTRPSHASGPSGGSPPKSQQNGKKQTARQGYRSQQGNRSQQDHKLHPKSSPEKPFQPQILKRPQQDNTAAVEDPALHTFSALPGPLSGGTQMPAPAQISTEVPTILPIHQSFDRRSSQTVDHKQTLLSLFGKSQSPAVPFTRTSTDDVLSPLQPIDPAIATSTRSRVGSLASGADGVSRRSSQAPMSPADKSFLLNYLDTVAKGAQR
jgi:mRNA-decapping enzyme subunit 2